MSSVNTPTMSSSIACLPADQRLRGRSNYATWAHLMQHLLASQGLFKCIEIGTSFASIEEFKTLDAAASATILMNIEPGPAQLVLETGSTSKKIWDMLKSKYFGNDYGLKEALIRSISNLKYSDFGDMDAFVDEFMHIRGSLAELDLTLPDEFYAIELLEKLELVLPAWYTKVTASGKTTASSHLRVAFGTLVEEARRQRRTAKRTKRKTDSMSSVAESPVAPETTKKSTLVSELTKKTNEGPKMVFPPGPLSYDFATGRFYPSSQLDSLGSSGTIHPNDSASYHGLPSTRVPIFVKEEDNDE